MSITRSQIARQLLAEGGAPRKPFAKGGFDYEGDAYGTTSMADYASSDNFSYGEDQEADVARMEASMNINQLPGSVSDEDLKALSYVNYNRPTRTPDRFSFGIDNFSPFPVLGAVKKGLQGFDNFIGRVTNRDAINRARRRDYLVNEGIIRSGPLGDEDLETQGFIGDLASKEGLDFARSKGYTTIQDVINKNEGGDNEPIKKIRAPITEAAKKEEPKNEFNELLKFYGSRFADGGEVREGYGLGSLVKKATGALKKIVKSPIGKAAILGFGAYKLGGGGELFTKFKNLTPLQQALLVGGTAATLSPFAMNEEDEEEKLPTAAQSDPEFQNLLAYYGGPRRFAEEGGDIEDAPKEKPSGIMMASNIENDEILENLFEKYLDMGLSPKDAADKAREEFEKMSKAKEPDRMTAQEGGLMNLGGNEMDLRGGGFVPLGAKEKADDVPARLSKNEFVFTADAVRAAGGGSVDRGADIMYKTMKNLENKVA